MLGVLGYVYFNKSNTSIVLPVQDEVIENSAVEQDGGSVSGIEVEIDTEQVNDSIDPDTMVITIPSWELSGEVEFTEYTVPRDPAVLKVSYEKLFEINANEQGTYEGFNFDSVSISEGVAILNISGNGYPTGDLSLAYLRENIQETAFQFDTVNELEVYLNGELFNWCEYSDADPIESGCDVSPRYWVETK